MQVVKENLSSITSQRVALDASNTNFSNSRNSGLITMRQFRDSSGFLSIPPENKLLRGHRRAEMPNSIVRIAGTGETSLVRDDSDERVSGIMMESAKNDKWLERVRSPQLLKSQGRTSPIAKRLFEYK